ncbi:MAG: hypothetical protein QM767_14270 [Anaeromyxobacter sp.]
MRPVEQLGPTTAEPAPGLRQAALTLHALAPDDRGWILERLSESERRGVETLLGELAQLGIPAEARFVEEALAGSAPAPSLQPEQPVPTAAELPEDRLDALGAAHPRLLAELLESEPAGLRVRVLGIRAWRWKEEVLRRLEGSEQLTVDLLGSASPVRRAPALEAALVEALLSRLEEVVTTAEPVRTKRGWLARWGLWRGGRR